MIGDGEKLQADGRGQMAEGGEKGVNNRVGEDFFGGGKGGEERDDSSKTDNFRYSPSQH